MDMLGFFQYSLSKLEHIITLFNTSFIESALFALEVFILLEYNCRIFTKFSPSEFD